MRNGGESALLFYAKATVELFEKKIKSCKSRTCNDLRVEHFFSGKASVDLTHAMDILGAQWG